MPRPRFARLPEEKQARILEIAAAEFAQSGFEGASYNRIIEQAGLSKGAMYYYFDDKTDLYATVLEDAMGRLMTAAFVADDRLGRWAQYEAWWRQSIRFAHAHPDLAALVRGFMSAPPQLRSHPRVVGLYERIEVMTRDELLAGQAQGLVREDLPLSLLSSVIFAVGEAVDRWAFTHLEELEEADLERWARAIIGLFRRVAEPREEEKE